MKNNIKKKYQRILEISEDSKQITLPDSRYYRRDGEYYQSVTYVLGYWALGFTPIQNLIIKHILQNF